MCGIVGVFNLDGRPVLSPVLRAMTDALVHRGPDGEGFYIDSYLGLGHRRLAIIDLSPLGHQPMLSADGQFILTYNGELYNYLELRAELEALGHVFVSHSDTEVILQAYIAWGEAMLPRLNGMFAFAIWDRPRQELFLARDRYGIKPLYYSFQGQSFLFGSEQKAFLPFPGFRRALDSEALLEYFTFQNIFTDRTLLKGVRLFPAGSWARLSLGSRATALNCHRYWDYHFAEPEQPGREADYQAEFEYLFEQAVRRQLVSDVAVGAFLSGGIDSGSIAAVASRQIPFMRTFTCGFDLHSASGLELAFDEREKAEHMSYLFKTEHYEMVLKAGDMERVLPKLAWHLEEPRVGQSYPNYYVAQLASKFNKVCLAGTGGDELFGGYPWRYYRAVVNTDFEDYVDKYYHFWHRLIPNRDRQQVFAPIWQEVSHVWTRDIFRDVFANHANELASPEDYINHSLYFEAKTFLHGLLMVEDKLGMAHGLETRVPFLDNDLVDFALRLPVSLKLSQLQEVVKMNENEPGPKADKYFERTRDGKLLLRQSLQKYVPQTVFGAVKQGFSAPDASWFRGESIDYVRRCLLDPQQPIYRYLDYSSVARLLQEHLEGRENRRLFIWSLLNFANWHHRYLETA
ncbi:MAG: asparagine synthase (glutamine-hydrolyzing) [Candidatus Sericytochromatia bacterium]